MSSAVEVTAASVVSGVVWAVTVKLVTPWIWVYSKDQECVAVGVDRPVFDAQFHEIGFVPSSMCWVQYLANSRICVLRPLRKDSFSLRKPKAERHIFVFAEAGVNMVHIILRYRDFVNHR
jgi:hypothetical protein